MAIKLLLIEDVEDLGRSGDIVNVKPGFARNFLMPQGFGVVADKNALRMQARLQERSVKAAHDLKEAEELSTRFEGLVVETIVKVDQEGHMYGSVSSQEVAKLLEDQAKIVIEKRMIQMKHAIKETGVQTINVKLKEGITTSFTLKIVPEEIVGIIAKSGPRGGRNKEKQDERKDEQNEEK